MPFFVLRHFFHFIYDERKDANGKAEEGKSTAFKLKSYKAANSKITNQFGGRKMIIKYEIACKEAGLSDYSGLLAHALKRVQRTGIAV